MNRLAKWLMCLYPSRWRWRYGDEVSALIDDTGASAKVLADLFKGAVGMQFSTWSFPRLAAILALAGVLAGLGISLLTAPKYVARTELRLSDADSGVATMEMLRAEVTSRTSLSGVINDRRLLLYREQLRTLPLEDVIGQMRADISMDLDNAGNITIQFTYPDRLKADLTIRALAALAGETLQKTIANTRRTGPQLPSLDVADSASLPTRPSRPNLWLAALAGLIAGVSLAVIWNLARRLAFKTFCKVALVGAVSGVVMAWLVPFSSGLIPEGPLPLRYESHATMFADDENIVPIGTLTTWISSRTSLALLINDPRLQLYADRLNGHTLEDVAEAMKKDVNVSTRSAGGGGRWIDISFIYSDRFKCQQVVQEIMNRLEEQYQTRVRSISPAPLRLTRVGRIDSGSAPNVIVEKITSDRASPALFGLVAGLCLAALIAIVRKRWTAGDEEVLTPEPEPARRPVFRVRRFRKLALWLTAAGTLAGMAVVFITRARYTSEALVSFDNETPSHGAMLIDKATSRESSQLKGGRRDLTWRQVEAEDTMTDAFRLQFVSDSPLKARAALQDALRQIDMSLLNLHGGDETPYEAIRGVDGALLPVMDENVPGGFRNSVPVQSVDPIAFDDEHAKPAAQPQYRAVTMNVIDVPSLPSGADGMGWWRLAIGAMAGLVLAALIGLITGSGRWFTPKPTAEPATPSLR